MRAEIARRLEAGAQRVRPDDELVEQLYKQGALSRERFQQVVFVEGASNLVAESRTGSDCRNC